MKQSINLSTFRTAFHHVGRGDQFSYEGLELIFEYIEEYEQDSGEEIELDVIALCCEWSEETPEEIAKNYSIDLEGIEEDDIPQAVMDYLFDETQVAGMTSTGTIVYVSF